MVTIKGGTLKGGTTKKKKHYMDDRKPQQMRATGYSAGTKVRTPKQLEGALGSPRSEPRTTPRAAPRPVVLPRHAPKGPPKPKPARTSKPMPASIPKAEGSRRNQVSISRETLPGKALGYLVSGPASRTDADRKKRAERIRKSQGR